MSGPDLVTSVCEELLHDVDDIVARMVARIRREFPEYAVVAGSEQVSMVVEEIRNVIMGFRDRRPPRPADARHGELLGRRRAEQGIPLESLIGAYNTGYDLLWAELHTRVVSRDPAREAELLPVVYILMAWLRSMTGTVAESYAMVTAAREESRLALAQTFVTGLARGGTASEATESAARGLGLDPSGPFQVICAAAGEWTSGRLRDLRRELRGPAAVVVTGRTLVVVTQGVPVETVLPLLGDRPAAGVGLTRRGLGGAARSLVDAQRALALAERRRADGSGSVVHFERDWLPATLLPHASLLAPLLDSGDAQEHPHLAEAVRAYANHDFSIKASGEALHVHANTVKYRLTRWHQLTGWDPRTFDGLVRSMVSLAGLPATPEPGSGAAG